MIRPQKYDWRLTEAIPFNLRRQELHYTDTVHYQDMHDAVHFGTVLAGSLLGKDGILLHPGGTYFTDPWEIHGIRQAEPGALILFTFDLESMVKLLGEDGRKFRQLVLAPPAFRHQALQTMPIPDEAIFDAPPRSQWLTFGALFARWTAACSDLKVPETVVYSKLAPALQALHSGEYMPLTIPQAAELCCLSVGYFSHLFKNHYGLAFAAYERQYRLRRAAEALAENGITLKEAAEQFGFTDKSHLSKLLRSMELRPGTEGEKINCTP